MKTFLIETAAGQPVGFLAADGVDAAAQGVMMWRAHAAFLATAAADEPIRQWGREALLSWQMQPSQVVIYDVQHVQVACLVAGQLKIAQSVYFLQDLA